MTETAPKTVEPLEGPESGYAAFNKTLGTYVGGVHRGENAKRDAGQSKQAKAAKAAGHDVEVRAV
jgi:hypothetical protein